MKSEVLSCRRLLFSLQIIGVLATTLQATKAEPFAWLTTLLVVGEIAKAPVIILSDAAVVAATTDSGQYGKCAPVFLKII